MNEFERNWTFKALDYRTAKNTKIYLYISRFGAKSSMFVIPFGLLSSYVLSPSSRPPYKTALHAHSTSRYGQLARLTSRPFDAPVFLLSTSPFCTVSRNYTTVFVFLQHGYKILCNFILQSKLGPALQDWLIYVINEVHIFLIKLLFLSCHFWSSSGNNSNIIMIKLLSNFILNLIFTSNHCRASVKLNWFLFGSTQQYKLGLTLAKNDKSPWRNFVIKMEYQEN